MSPFEYVLVLISIVVGLSVARLLTGIGEQVLVRGGVRIYWVHLVWAVNVLIYTVLVWWVAYRWRTVGEWNFLLALFVLLPPTGLYLLSVILFPGPQTGPDMKTHYYAQRRSFFLLFITLQLIDVVDTLLKGWAHFQAQGAIYVFSHLLIGVLNIIAATTTRERFHQVYAVFFAIYFLTWISISALTLT